MDVITLTVLIGGIGMLLAIFAGMLQVHYGFKLYQDGTGTNEEKSHLEFGKLKLRTNSTGAVVMAFASLWAFAAIQLQPGIKKSGDDWEVQYSLNDELDLKARTLATKLVPQDTDAKNLDNISAKTYLTRAIHEQHRTDSEFGAIFINGEPAEYEIDSIEILTTEEGRIVLTSLAKAKGQPSARVAFNPIIEKNKVIFVPSGVGEELSNEYMDIKDNKKDKDNKGDAGKDEKLQDKIGDAT